MGENLGTETLNFLKDNGKKENEVLWVGYGTNCFSSWQDFLSMALKTEYDSGYGSQEIDCDLTIVAKDWWARRAEYGWCRMVATA